MTVNEALAGAVEILGDTVSREALILWLWEIENTVIEEIAKTHVGITAEMNPINKECDGDRVLFAPDPYSQLYVHYLQMKGDQALHDTARYQNSATQFSVLYNNFSDWYNRTYMPLSGNKIKL